MYLDKTAIDVLLEKRDLIKESDHCVSVLIDEIKQRLAIQYNLSPSVELGEKIVSLKDNYYELGYAEDEITLSTRYTKYVSDSLILRTQMSSAIPKLLREYDGSGDRLWMCPGVVYRRDVRDKTHVGEPHQMDIWHLTSRQMQRSDLLQLVQTIISVIEDVKKVPVVWRYNETSHNYTDGGIEVEIYHNNQWLEILECGLISKALLERNGLSGHGGLALGMGLERLVMIIKEIDDIRILYSESQPIKCQMHDLCIYKKVSTQPSIKRDLSIACASYLNEEELTEMVIGVKDIDTENIESVKVIAEAEYSNLPEVAKERLGMHAGQKNVLMRIVLRNIGRTLRTEEANEMYSKIYSEIHKGSVGYYYEATPKQCVM